jgi:hypothetical protein
MQDTLIFTTCYVFLIAVVSAIYNFIGYREGVKSAIESIRQFEPAAVERAMAKMRIEHESE